MDKKIYFIWIWWIWISALARYYNEIWYKVYWSDKTSSELIENLKKENIDIIIWQDKNRIDNNSFEKIIYTEAIKKEQEEYKKAKELWLELLSYPEWLWQVANDNNLITISWTHGKSTTTSMASIMLKNSGKNFSSIIWTLLTEFWWKNFYHRDNNKIDKEKLFVIEACEYRRSFLNYKPFISIITNIEIDHLDYYKDLSDYIKAFKELVYNIKNWGFLIINWQENNSRQLIELRKDISIIEVFDNYFIYNWQKIFFPEIKLNIPGWHILYDAKLVYVLWYILNIDKKIILDSLESYNWVWRRMEYLWQSNNWNIFISDYGHHPTEIKLTLEAIKNKYLDKNIITIFQPHQYSRTFELLKDFKLCFNYTDKLIIPNIYESRDSEEDKKRINVDLLLKNIEIEDKENWQWLDKTLERILELDKEKNNVFILMWAWDIDNLRYKLNLKR